MVIHLNDLLTRYEYFGVFAIKNSKLKMKKNRFFICLFFSFWGIYGIGQKDDHVVSLLTYNSTPISGLEYIVKNVNGHLIKGHGVKSDPEGKIYIPKNCNGYVEFKWPESENMIAIKECSDLLGAPQKIIPEITEGDISKRKSEGSREPYPELNSRLASAKNEIINLKKELKNALNKLHENEHNYEKKIEDLTKEYNKRIDIQRSVLEELEKNNKKLFEENLDLNKKKEQLKADLDDVKQLLGKEREEHFRHLKMDLLSIDEGLNKNGYVNGVKLRFFESKSGSNHSKNVKDITKVNMIKIFIEYKGGNATNSSFKIVGKIEMIGGKRNIELNETKYYTSSACIQHDFCFVENNTITWLNENKKSAKKLSLRVVQKISSGTNAIAKPLFEIKLDIINNMILYDSIEITKIN